ncbi:hypothetical protein Nepgr_017178 [Nepenthes gracilis]|uniref:Tetratricopeptide repeat protein 38 n=1 Tax=Nepenthes gracilis TaxID=150966 RepID=A0AAD3SQP9_NEPGR|nr:hypothetical protein Nepgr_017178 [Nepenthes gracilis]
MEEGGRGVKSDKWGYQVKTSSDACISAINAFYDQVLSYGRGRSVILKAPIHDQHCVLANILAAHYLCSIGTDPSKISSYLLSAKSNYDEATCYEKAIFDAVSYLMTEDRDDDVAVELHAQIARDFPKDLVSLKRAQILCFYMGQPKLTLDLIQQVLPKNQEASYIYGMLAFPLLELGDMKNAEQAARKALEINEHDFWAQHCLCHVLQQECHFEEAVKFMEECSWSWNSCLSFMYVHNWWHVAVCYLEGHSPIGKVLDVYDYNLMRELERPDSSPVEVYINALGLLLRVFVHGEIGMFEDRLKDIATHLTNQTIWYVEWHLDLLSLWALATTGEHPAAKNLLDGLKSRVSKMNLKKQLKMQRGLLLAEALYEYGKGNDEKALALLGLDFDAMDYKMIGASDEQLDVFNEVWYSLLLNTGNATKATHAIEKQLKNREGVPFLWRLLEKAYLMQGRQEAASAAAEKANALENAYFK